MYNVLKYIILRTHDCDVNSTYVAMRAYVECFNLKKSNLTFRWCFREVQQLKLSAISECDDCARTSNQKYIQFNLNLK